jgi:hypothetical protein
MRPRAHPCALALALTHAEPHRHTTMRPIIQGSSRGDPFTLRPCAPMRSRSSKQTHATRLCALAHALPVRSRTQNTHATRPRAHAPMLSHALMRSCAHVTRPCAHAPSRVHALSCAHALMSAHLMRPLLMRPLLTRRRALMLSHAPTSRRSSTPAVPHCPRSHARSPTLPAASSSAGSREECSHHPRSQPHHQQEAGKSVLITHARVPTLLADPHCPRPHARSLTPAAPPPANPHPRPPHTRSPTASPSMAPRPHRQWPDGRPSPSMARRPRPTVDGQTAAPHTPLAKMPARSAAQLTDGQTAALTLP